MLISLRNRFIFISNTKAASTSIEAALQHHCEIRHNGTPARKHIAYRDALREYQPLFSAAGNDPVTYFRFGVLRDPIDWIASWFRYRSGNDVQAPLPPGMSFREFWQNNDWNITRPNGNRHLQRARFEDDSGQIAMHCLIRFEDLPNGFEQVLRCLGLEAQLPFLNKSNIVSGADVVPDDMRDELRKFYHADYEIYDNLSSFNAAGLARWNSDCRHL